MSKKTKWAVVATEGATTDGRKISREWIEQMAKHYDPKNQYGARINLEHIKFRFYEKNEPHSKCYGDVLALKTAEREDGKLQLLAELQPTDELIELVKSGQKVYTSIEVDPSFADTGEAYLVGLAVTDNPASLGTEMLTFAAQSKINPLSARKVKDDNVFTAAVETLIEFNEEQEAKPSIAEKIKAMFAKKDRKDDARFSDLEKAIELLSEQTLEIKSKLEKMDFADATALEQVKTELSTVQKTIAGLETQPQFTEQRPVVTGATDNERFF